MAINETPTRNQYTAAAGQTVFPYTFEIFDDDDIAVQKNGILLSKGTDYSVTGVGNDSGGDVTLSVGATAGDVITIYRDMPLERVTDYQQSGDFLAEEVNDDFDRLWAALQQNLTTSTSAIRAKIDDPSLNSSNTELSSVPTRANKSLGFNSLGELDYFSQAAAVVGTLREYSSLSAAISDIVNISIGDILLLKDRTAGNGGGGVWDAVDANSVTENTYNVVAGNANISLVLRVNRVVTVEQWGLIGDNSTDNTAALTNLISYASINGVKIALSSGTYRISTIDLTGINGIIIEGNGGDKSILLGNANSPADFVFGADGYDSGTPANSVFTRRLVLRDMSIQAANSDQYNHCVKCYATTEWDFQNVALGGNGYVLSTLGLQFCNNNRFEGGTISNLRLLSGNTFAVGSGTNNVNLNTFVNVRMTGAAPGTSAGTSVGVEVKGNTNQFINCDISNFDYGAWPDASKGTVFSGCYFEKTTACIIQGLNPVGGIVKGLVVFGGLFEVLTNGTGIVTADAVDSAFGAVIIGAHFNGVSGGSNRTAIDTGAQSYTLSAFGCDYTNIDNDIIGTLNPGGGLGERRMETLKFAADGTTTVADGGQFDQDTVTADGTRFLIYDIAAGTFKKVTRGAADSAGLGFRQLRIAN